MSAKYKSPSFLLPNELNTSANTANDTGVNSLYSMDFDSSSSDYIDIGISLNGLSSITYSCWVKASSFKNYSYIISTGNYASGERLFGILLDVNGSFQAYGGYSSGAVLDSNVDLSSNTWYHLAVVYTNNQDVAFYVNGAAGSTGSFTNTNLIAASSPTRIGSYSASVANLFDGQIDEVAIFNRALNTTEISALYDGTGSNIRPSNLMASNLNPIAYYPLGEQAQMQGYLGNEASSEWQFPNGVLQDYVMDFDGSASSAADFINTSNTSIGNIGSNPHTFSAWINIADHGQVQTILSNKNSNGWKFEVSSGASPDNITFYISGTNLLRATFPSSSYGSWINAVAVINGSSSKIYINGVDQSASVTGTLVPTDSTEPLIIGAQDNGSGTYIRSLNGQMSNVQIFSSALPATGSNSVQTLYNNGSPLTSMSGFTSLTNWWKLNADSVYTPSAPNYTTALDFGGSQSVDTNYTGLDGLSKATISLWVKPDVASANGTIFNARDGSAVGMNCQFFTSKTYLYFTGSINVISANYTPPFSDNLWANLVIVFDGTLTGNDRIKLYANGETKVIDTYNGTIPAVLPTSSTSLKIAESFNGQVSNFAIFNSALTSSQVSTLFNFGTPETNISFSPQAWWKLDDQTTITDSSDNGNTGTNNGATDISSGVAVTPSWKIPDASGTVNGVSTTLPSTALQQSDLQFDSPYSNYSLNFDGATYVDFGNDSSLTPINEISISLWIKTNTTSQTQFSGPLDKHVSGTGGYQFFFPNSSSSEIKFALGNPKVSLTSTTQVGDTNWHHILATCDNVNCKLYIDGVLESTVSANLSTLSNSENLKIGGDGVSTFYFNGQIDETAIWNTALTNAQVLEIYNNGKPKDLTTFSGTAPTNWWRLGENAYFDNNSFIVPNSISGAPNGTGSGTITTMISADAPGTYANGVGENLDILDRVGDAPLSVANSQSYNMIPSDISPYVPQYVGDQIANNSSMTFDGVDDYFNAGNPTELQITGELSISLWFKTSTTPATSGYLISKGVSPYTSRNFAIWFSNNNTVRAAVNGVSGLVTSPASNYNDDNWHHCVFTFTPSTSTILYIDGSAVVTNTTSIPSAITNNTSNLEIGRYVSEYFTGEIDEVAIWNTALNAGQIYNDIYQPTSTATNQTADLVNNPNLPNPVAWYRMGD